MFRRIKSGWFSAKSWIHINRSRLKIHSVDGCSAMQIEVTTAQIIGQMATQGVKTDQAVDHNWNESSLTIRRELLHPWPIFVFRLINKTNSTPYSRKLTKLMTSISCAWLQKILWLRRKMKKRSPEKLSFKFNKSSTEWPATHEEQNNFTKLILVENPEKRHARW